MNKVLIFGIVAVILIFVVGVYGTMNFESLPEKEVYYEIGLSGINEEYVVGEELEFSIYLNGYGSPCGDYSANVKKEENFVEEWHLEATCLNEEKRDLEFNIAPTTTYKLILTEPGSYTATGEFWKSGYGKFQDSETFTVIEK